MRRRRYIEPGTKVPFRLSLRERNLILEVALVDPDLERRLRIAATVGTMLEVELTLDDIDELAGWVAAEANHCEDARRQRALDRVFDRLTQLEDRFTDEQPRQT